MIRIVADSEEVILELTDEGRGLPARAFDNSPTEFALRGLGIASMRERVRILGGRFEVSSGKGGTTVKAAIPIQEA